MRLKGDSSLLMDGHLLSESGIDIPLLRWTGIVGEQSLFWGLEGSSRFLVFFGLCWDSGLVGCWVASQDSSIRSNGSRDLERDRRLFGSTDDECDLLRFGVSREGDRERDCLDASRDLEHDRRLALDFDGDRELRSGVTALSTWTLGVEISACKLSICDQYSNKLSNFLPVCSSPSTFWMSCSYSMES